MTSDYEIVNLALVRLGATRITALTDGSRNANEASAIYASIRDDELSKHPWKFASRRSVLEEYAENELTISGITQANPGVVTYTGTDPDDGDEYLIEDVTGMTEVNDITFMIHDVNTVANTFELYDTYGDPVDTTTYTAYAAAGTATEVMPISDYFDKMYVLPTGCLRVHSINDRSDIEFEIDEHGLMCNVDEVQILYSRQNTTVSTYSAEFISAFAWRLAQELAVVITGSMAKLKAAATMYTIDLEKAKAADASEKREEHTEFTRYADARR